MKQSLIDQFRPEIKKLSEAKSLQQALENLPEETIQGEIDEYSYPIVAFSPSLNLVQIRYSNSPRSILPVVFPSDAQNCRANGSVCSFTYRGLNYQIN